MKSNGSFKRFVPLAMSIFGAFIFANAQTTPAGMVLVAGTEFTAPGYESEVYVGLDEIAQEGIVDGVFSTNTLYIGDDPDVNGITFDSKTGASNFHDTPHYAITNNPIKLDSAAYMDMEESNWYMVFSTPESKTASLFKYTAGGFKPGSAVSVKMKICRLIDTDGMITGETASNGGICQYEPLVGKVRVNQAYSSISRDKDFNVNSAGGCGEIEISAVASGDGTVIVDLVPRSMFNSSCSAYFIDYVYIYGSIVPKVVASEAEVCVGGERVTLSLDNTYKNVSYQWYKKEGNSAATAISGATKSTYTHVSGQILNLETTYYCEIKTKDGNTFKSEDVTVTDIECCTDDRGEPLSRKLVWQEDFGTFTSATEYWTWDYTDISNPKKKYYTDGEKWQRSLEVAPEGAEFFVVEEDGKCSDNNYFEEGRYTVAANVRSYGNSGDGNYMGWAGYFGNGKRPNENGLAFAPDHTYDKDNSKGYGGMLFYNVGAKTNSVIYSRTIKGLCNRIYTVQCFINNFSAGTKPVEVFVRLTDPLDPSNRVESQTVVRYANEAAGLGWKCPKATIQLTGSELLFEIVSKIGNAPGQNNEDPDSPNNDGNDLILDDIQLWTCSSPSVGLYYDVETYQTDLTSCGDVDIYVDESVMLKKVWGSDLAYVYQYTTDDPESYKCKWKHLHSNTTTKPLFNVKDAYDLAADNSKIYFRVVAGSTAVLSANEEFNAYDPCASYSVSNVISMTIDCPTCTKPQSDIKIAADRAIDKDNVISLCYGESVILSQKADITPAESDWSGPDFEGFAIKWFESESTVDMNNAELVLNGTISNKVITFKDSTLAGTIMPVSLHAVDAIYPDGNCMTNDIIYIRFNSIVDAEFITSKVEFNEGKGKGEVNLTLTNGTSEDFLINWWLDKTKIETSFDVEFFENMKSENSGIYTYQLTNKETGCVGDLHNFDVKISPATEVKAISIDDNDEIINVYTISGALIKENVKRSEALNGLTNGTYLVGSQKVVVNK